MSPKLHPYAKWVQKLQIKGIKNMPWATMLSLYWCHLISLPLCFTEPDDVVLGEGRQKIA